MVLDMDPQLKQRNRLVQLDRLMLPMSMSILMPARFWLYHELIKTAMPLLVLVQGKLLMLMAIDPELGMLLVALDLTTIRIWLSIWLRCLPCDWLCCWV